MHLQEIDNCTAFGPCSACTMTPSSFLVCEEQKWREGFGCCNAPGLPFPRFVDSFVCLPGVLPRK